MTNQFNLERIQVLKILVNIFIYVSGVAILIWQVQGTFESFIINRTSFATKQETFDSLVPPTIVFCLRNPKSGSYKNWGANISIDEFFWLNEKLNLTIDKYIVDTKPEDNSTETEKQLSLGRNFDGNGNLLVTVEELMNPFIGLCYAIIPSENFKLQIEELIILRAEFEPKLKKAAVYFTSEEDRYGLLFQDLGRTMPFMISLDAGVTVGVNLKKLVWNKLSSKGNCKQYIKEQSHMECMLKHQMDCFRSGNQSCKCVLENSHKTHFKLFPSEWNVCTNDEEYICSTFKMDSCYPNEDITEGCPLPCETEEYQGQKMYHM